MTTIAVRAGVMAADMQGNYSGMRVTSQKLFRVGGSIIGFSGTYMDGLSFVEWVRAGMDMDNLPKFIHYGDKDTPDFTALALTQENLTLWTQHFQPEPVSAEFYAIGSGRMAAMAAMHMGANVGRAVEIAHLVDVETGPDVYHLALVHLKEA